MAEENEVDVIKKDLIALTAKRQENLKEIETIKGRILREQRKHSSRAMKFYRSIREEIILEYLRGYKKRGDMRILDYEFSGYRLERLTYFDFYDYKHHVRFSTTVSDMFSSYQDGGRIDLFIGALSNIHEHLKTNKFIAKERTKVKEFYKYSKKYKFKPTYGNFIDINSYKIYDEARFNSEMKEIYDDEKVLKAMRLLSGKKNIKF